MSDAAALLLRLAGPMQSWGTQSRFGNRDTGLEPSKSGVIGLLCCALGWQRGYESFDFDGPIGVLTIEQLARTLNMVVRVDREGQMARDFHTAQNVLRADRSGTAETVLSERFYLADADFLVALGGPRTLLERLDAAVRDPVWPICLGRKSFVPGVSIAGGVADGDVWDAIQRRPWCKRGRWDRPPEMLRVVFECAFGAGPEVRADQPLSFARRQFTIRHVSTAFLPDAAAGRVLPPIEETPCL